MTQTSTNILLKVSVMLNDLWVMSFPKSCSWLSPALPLPSQLADLGGAERGCGREMGSGGGHGIV